ncbi:phage holin family protein [Actinomyces sp. ZJ308]|uniref:phage holin family protein n=1 Tax=Actinomyces sp. ZJ308 TaxID=2708342 RepID=UPI00141E8D74|nr:phage holin family protein [Actinomyces sp. ZJ308]
MPNNQPPPPPSQATPSASAVPPRGTNGSQPTLGELIARISENISALVRGEIDLAKAKGQRMAKEMGLGAGLLGAAGVLALFIFGLLLGSLTSGLSNVMPLWAAFLVVALILTVIAVPLALVGVKRLQAAKESAPTPQEGLMESVNTVKGAVASGLERGNAK